MKLFFQISFLLNFLFSSYIENTENTSFYLFKSFLNLTFLFHYLKYFKIIPLFQLQENNTTQAYSKKVISKKKKNSASNPSTLSQTYLQTPTRVLLQRQDKKLCHWNHHFARPFSFIQPHKSCGKTLESVCRGTRESNGRKKEEEHEHRGRASHGAWNKSEGNRRNSDAKGERARRDRRVFWLSVGSRSGAMCSVSSCSNL